MPKSLLDKRFCVYVYRNNITGAVFYVGEGVSRKRGANTALAAKSKECQEIVKRDGASIEVIESDLTKHTACQTVDEVVELLREMKVPLVNKLRRSNRAKEIYSSDFNHLTYCPNTPGNLIYTQDQYSGGKNKYLRTLSGSKAAWFNKQTGYYSNRGVAAHRIVWALHHGYCPGHLQINHIDGDKTNNRIENLELVTPSQNRVHAFVNGLIPSNKGEKNHMATLTELTVLEIYNLIRMGMHNEQIEGITGVAWKNVSLIRHGKRWRHLYDMQVDTPFPPSRKPVKHQ